jgi:hypothetical protein
VRHRPLRAVLTALLAGAVCGAAGVDRGRAETVSIAVEAEILVPPLQRLEVTPNLLTWPQPTGNDLAAGHIDADPPILATIYSNTPWDLAVRVVQTDARAIDGGAAPVSAGSVPILYRRQTGDFALLSPDWVVIASGAFADGESVRLELRIPLDWMQSRPGEYAPRLEYRLAPAGR